MSADQITPVAEIAAASTLEILWQQDASAYVFRRSPGGELSAEALPLGKPAVADLALVGTGVEARRVEVVELIRLAETRPAGLEPGDSAAAVFAIVKLAQRSLAEGLVHPTLTYDDGEWSAFWGATLDTTVQAALGEIAAAMPPVSAGAFDGDANATVLDLYPVVVDQLARDRLRAARVRLTSAAPYGRRGAVDLFLDGLAAPEPGLQRHSGYAALERRLSRWVGGGLERRSSAPWRLGLRLDERERAAGPPALLAELWLEAEDDPTLALPASRLWDGGAEIFAFVRSSDPQRDLIRQLTPLEPVLAEAGLAFDEREPTKAELADDEVAFFLREVLPKLEERGVTVQLPSAWLRAPRRLRVNLTATTRRTSSGLLSPAALAEFDWRLALGDTQVTEAELEELAKAKESFIQVGGRWQAVRRSEIERALRFLEQRRGSAGIVDLVRAVSGLETDEAGLELGDVALDDSLAELLQDAGSRFRPRATPAPMRFPLFPFQERGHGWLRMLGDLGIGAVLADDMGLGKTVQAIAMLVSEREDAPGALGPTLVVCPMSVVRQWEAELEKFAPSLRVHVHHGLGRLSGAELAERTHELDAVVTSYDIATRDAEALAGITWDRLLLDEAQDIKNPATKRARALRRLPARRRVAMTGTPIENRLGELWAIMNVVNPGLLGSRDWFDRTFARPIETFGDEQALERLQSIVGPFVLRRAKDAPEIELELPPITIEKDYCRLTVEQASLYRATVDRWMPQIAERTDTFGRRGAVLTMLGQLKQVCNHPEMVLPTGRPLDGRSGKLERLIELLGEVPAHDKALVFTQYPGFDRLVPHLEERLGRSTGFFHGRLNAGRREELLHDFASDDGPSLLVISIRAGGRGLNLPAANHVFHFDRWWNPAVEQQATDRVYRFGQRKHVFVHSLICTGTLEERIDRLLESKRELAEKVIAGRSEDWLADLDLGAIRAAVALAPDAIEGAA
jgi:SNF2-related domain/SNF2 Helicase protein/Helicase conserved C-terminal domain